MTNPENESRLLIRLGLFVLMGFGISWGSVYVAHLGADSLPEFALTFLNYLAKFGPSIAGVVLILRDSARDPDAPGLAARFLRPVPIRWYVFALAAPSCVWMLVLGIIYMTAEDDVTITFETAALLTVVPLLLMRVFLGGGLGEEVGWRGWMLPALQARFSPQGSSWIIGILWGVWHWPAFFIANTGKEGGIVLIVLFTVLTVVYAFIFTWVFNRSNGSLIVAILLHGSMNASENWLQEVVPVLDDAVVVYGLVLLTAALMMVATRPRHWFRKGTPYPESD